MERAERFSSPAAEGERLRLSIWEKEERFTKRRSLRARRPSRRAEELIDRTITGITPVRCYTMNPRKEVPADSNRYFVWRYKLQYISHYQSPMGDILLAADAIGLTGLWFEGQKYFALSLDREHEEKELPVFEHAKRWLNIYFSGKEPDFKVPLHFTGTAFQNTVWGILYTIPYGQTMTYGDIAKQLAAKRGLAHMSAQAVGGAVGRNEISIMVPCHRVVGANGSLTGYAGGIDKKMTLLKLEKAFKKEYFIPKHSTAP